jgi:capsular polysaccharide biosynthesis protein
MIHIALIINIASAHFFLFFLFAFGTIQRLIDDAIKNKKIIQNKLNLPIFAVVLLFAEE